MIPKLASTGLKNVALSRASSRHAFAAVPLRTIGYLGTIPFLVGALIIFTLSVRDNKAIHHLNAVVLDLTTPLVDAVTQPFTALASWSDALRSQTSLVTEVEGLREENGRLSSLVQSLRQKTLDYAQLQQLSHALPDARIERVSARVVGRVSDGMNALLTIKASHGYGIAKDQAVITANGVVGRISEVGGFSSTTARVMPLTDLSSRIPVEVESSQDHGIVAGQNGAELRLIHLEKRAKVKVGDRLMTSGYGGIFPRGLPVAVVTRVEGETITARPFVTQTPAFVTILLGL